VAQVARAAVRWIAENFKILQNASSRGEVRDPPGDCNHIIGESPWVESLGEKRFAGAY